MSAHPSFRPTIEPLETRELPAAGLQAYLQSNSLVIEGTPGNDYISVTQSGGRMWVYGTSISVGRGKVASVDQNGVSRVYINGNAGNDIIIANTLTKDAVIRAGAGNDSIYAGAGNDWIDGGAGNDMISAGAGDDRIIPGPSANERDSVFGGAGNNWYWRPHNASAPFVGGADVADVRQGEAPVCQTAAALAAAVRQGHDFTKDIRRIGHNLYEVKLYGNLATQRVSFDGWTTSADPAVINGEFWTVLMHRARMQAFGMDPAREYSRAEWDAWNQRSGGQLYSIGESIYHFTGFQSTYATTAKINASALKSALARGELVIAQSASTNGYANGDGIIGNHAYAVVDVYKDAGVWKVRLYNPWGVDRIDGGTLDALDRRRAAANDGYITLTWQQFANSVNFKGVFQASRKVK